MIQSTEHSVNYYARFIVVNHHCARPVITVYYQDSVQLLNVYHNNNLLSFCRSSNNSCGEYKYCLQQYPLGIPSVNPGQKIIIHVERGREPDYSKQCDYALYSDITLLCGTPSGMYNLSSFSMLT